MTDQVAEQPKEEKAEEVKAEAKKASNRRKYRNDTWTDEQVAARKAELTVAEVPTDEHGAWVKMSEVHTAFNVAGIPVSRLVRATGGDRGMGEPVAPLWKIVYVGRDRYLSAGTLTQGIEEMQKNPNLASTPRKPKAPKAEGETGAVKGAKKEKAAKPAAGAKTVAKVADTGPREKVWEYKG